MMAPSGRTPCGSALTGASRAFASLLGSQTESIEFIIEQVSSVMLRRFSVEAALLEEVRLTS
jgi:hypothetical protein